MAKKGKISIATTIGLIAMAKNLYDGFKRDQERGTGTSYLIESLCGYRDAKIRAISNPDSSFDRDRVIATWLPPIVGSLASKYVGGPKGLNLNASLKSIPLFKL